MRAAFLALLVALVVGVGWIGAELHATNANHPAAPHPKRCISSQIDANTGRVILC